MAQQDLNELPVSDLVQRMSQQTADLVRKELELAQVEMKEKGKRAGIGAGLFGGAGLVTFYAVGGLIATAILGLSEAVDPWLAALIVTVVLFVIAGIAALVGKKQVDQATPPQPEQAIASTKQDVNEVKGRASRA
jgi:membrane protein